MSHWVSNAGQKASRCHSHLQFLPNGHQMLQDTPWAGPAASQPAPSPLVLHATAAALGTVINTLFNPITQLQVLHWADEGTFVIDKSIIE